MAIVFNFYAGQTPGFVRWVGVVAPVLWGRAHNPNDLP